MCMLMTTGEFVFSKAAERSINDLAVENADLRRQLAEQTEWDDKVASPAIKLLQDEVAALRRQLAQSWVPVEDGFYHDEKYDDDLYRLLVARDTAWLWLQMFDGPQLGIRLPDNLRLCCCQEPPGA